MGAEIKTTPTLDQLRERGWSVAVHNDYRLAGERRTFWLLTHPSGRWVKGEAVADEAALLDCLRQIEHYGLEKVPVPWSISNKGDGYLTLGFNSYENSTAFLQWVERMMKGTHS